MREVTETLPNGMVVTTNERQMTPAEEAHFRLLARLPRAPGTPIQGEGPQHQDWIGGCPRCGCLPGEEHHVYRPQWPGGSDG